MARHTSWRVGGPADRYYAPEDSAALAEFLHTLPAAEPLTWVGLGSNLLVRDGGIRGTVISLTRLPEQLEQSGELTVTASAGIACAKLARFCAEAGLTGAEFLAGIPGTLGGALAMNAGAWGGETWSVVEWVETLDRQGQRHQHSPSDYTIGYRSVEGPADEWFLRAGLVLQPDTTGRARTQIRDLLARRAGSQPMGQHSCGSVFRNPKNDHAARLIEACGLKGFSIGHARVSDKHANFIINTGGAAAADIEALIEHVQQAVRAQAGVELISEVRIIGEAAAPTNEDDRL
ncbi:MAG: UDP-N-acetylmuramate dehydrogenase [Gammaproteobacteria bacterium]|nr:UDP-N-acetylmuramate dehydrogenase [Gammaproteobacteria bacterium]